MSEFSWVTLATNDSYSLGALVLAHSLKRVGTRYQLVVMVTPGVTQPMREKLTAVFDVLFEVNILDSKDERNLLLLQRPELGITFTKLHCWRLTQFKKCVFLDADTLVLQNCDELFERDEFSAAPDVGWPDCFNSGVFVYKPSDETFNSLLAFALERGSFDGGDQGLLNLYFSDWAHKDISKHLPFIYNMCSTACYSYLPAFKQFGENVKIVHFIGNSKPWLQYFNSETLQVSPTPGFGHLQVIFDHWWNLFCAHVHSNLATSMARIDSHIASSCTSSSHTFTHSINESKCEDSQCTTQYNTDINKPIWDPWENYNPIQINDHLQNTQNDNEPIVDNSNDAFVSVVNSSYEHSSHSQTNYTDIETKPPSYTKNSQNTNYQHVENNSNVVETNITSSHVPTSPPPVHVHVNTPIHSESRSIPIINNEVHKSQNACASCQTVKSATEQPNNTVTETGNNEKGTDQNGGLAGAFAQMTLREPKSASQGALEEHLRRQGWEAGRIDYLGQDSFDNVWKKICETISAAPTKEPTPPKELPAKQPSPPKQIVEQQPLPPKEPSPPKQVEVQQTAQAAAPETSPAPVEAAPACAAPTAEASAPVASAIIEAPAALTPEIPAPVVPAPKTPAPVVPAPETPAPVVAAPEIPAPVVPAPETPASVVPPETPAPVVAAPETPAPVVAAPETPVPIVAAPETPAPVESAPIVLAAETAAPETPVPTPTPVESAPVAPTPETKPVPETVSPVGPTPVPETTTTPIVAAEPATPVAPIAGPPTPAAATEAVTVAPTKAVAPPVPEVTAAAPAPETVTPAEPPKQTETKAEEQKPKEVAATEEAATAPPPTITETPATPQTPDASKGEMKPVAAPATAPPKGAEGQSSIETPVPPPRKSGKNGGATSKKSSKKK